jgi:ubiquinone/menaquinone biosynthesis C-methylase UbiE
MFTDQKAWERLELGPNALAFLRRVYANGLDKYEQRLRALGFAHGWRGLDAGCGVGQWTFALATMCSEVHGVDTSLERLHACEQMAKTWRCANARFMKAMLEDLPFEDGSFDRVLCYSVLNLTHYEKSLQEIARVTREGGLLYISTNDFGRFLQQIIDRPNRAPDFDPRAYGLATLWNTLTGRRHGLSPQAGGVVTRRSRVLRLLKQNGFEVIECGPEGRLQGSAEPFLPETYFGSLSTFDILARKTS